MFLAPGSQLGPYETPAPIGRDERGDRLSLPQIGEKRIISGPEGLGSLGMERIAEFDVNLAQRARLVQACEGILGTEGFDVSSQSFAKVSDRFFFRCAFPIGWYVGNTSCVSTLIRIGNDLYSYIHCRREQ